MDGTNSLGRRLDALTRKAELYRLLPETDSSGNPLIECTACAFHCRIPPGGRGACRMRFHRDGALYAPYGYTAGIACDPIEKKPFYQFLPGRTALSYGMLGCNFHCPFCQNWVSSQTLRDPEALALPRECTPEQIVGLARRCGAPVVSSTYNEPLITSEWSRDVFALAKEQGLRTCYVSNGFASPEVLDYLDPVLDAMNVDIKCFSEPGYRRLGGRLGPVLDTVRALHDRGKWVEVVTLLVPEFNDAPDEIGKIAEFMASIDPEIPWHITAYHADYKVHSGPRRTPIQTLETALHIAAQAGLAFVYAGNVLGLGRSESTWCPQCGALLIERRGFQVLQMRVRAGTCPECGRRIPGVWNTQPHSA